MAKKVRFAGSLPHSQLAQLFQSSALAVFPFTKPEGLGLVLVEAMGCGCPVIASNVAGASDTIADQITGVLIKPNSVDAIRTAVNTLLNNPETAKRFSEKAHDFVFNRYNWNRSE